MADNSTVLRRARRHDSRIKRERALEAITAVESSGELISFPAVARRAGVSVSFLYADSELAGRIATARDRQRQAGRDRAWRLPARSLVTGQSLGADLTNTKDQVRRLTEEVALLRERLARQLGADADVADGRALAPVLDELEQRAAELEAENHRHRERITQLEVEGRELVETLDAARAMNRELMSELNRRPSTEHAPRASRG
ncbi:MAG: DUF6262 family protein [Acidimicrobiales bacterium]